MISKQNLLRRIESLLDLKERIVPLLNRHIASAISFSELNKDEQEKITGQLKLMAVEQQRHKEVLNGIKNSVMKGNSNAY